MRSFLISVLLFQVFVSSSLCQTIDTVKIVHPDTLKSAISDTVLDSATVVKSDTGSSATGDSIVSIVKDTLIVDSTKITFDSTKLVPITPTAKDTITIVSPAQPNAAVVTVVSKAADVDDENSDIEQDKKDAAENRIITLILAVAAPIGLLVVLGLLAFSSVHNGL